MSGLNLSEARARRAVAIAIEKAGARADGLELSIAGDDIATSRFANNEMTQNQSPCNERVSLRLISGNKQIRVAGEDLSESGISGLVETALRNLALMAPDDNLPPLSQPTDDKDFTRVDNRLLDMSPADRAEKIKEICSIAEKNKLSASGVVSSGAKVVALGNSNGLFRYYSESHLECSITMTGPDSSGWSKSHGCYLEAVDVEKMALNAARKAVESASPREISPGNYTVVLENSALLDLLGFFLWDFAGTSHIDKRSSLMNKLQERIFCDKIDIRDDAYHQEQSGAPFDGEGLPRKTVQLVKGGVLQELVYGRRSAMRAGFEPTGHGLPEPSNDGEFPMNIVMAGGDADVDELMATVEHGVLLSRVWYVREVDPARKILTGMTRDGTFLIKDGQLSTGLKNMRFNVNMFELLSSILMLGRTCRTAGEETFPAVVPSVVAENFRFTEVTRF